MKLTDGSLKNPAAVAVIVAMVCLFGWFSLRELPLQLFPDIEAPQMSVQTGWRAASPQEMESEILEPMENVLQGLPGLQQMEGNAFQGGSWVNLTFAVGTDMRAMLVEVLGRLNRMPQLPPDVNPPVVQLNGQESNQTLSWFFVQKLPGTEGEIEDYGRLIEERVLPRIEAVPGVAGVQVNGGPPEEVAIELDLDRAAALGIGIPQIAQQAARATDVSGGFFESGRRQYTLRFAGRYSPEELGNLILAWRDGRPVRLGDVATIAVKRPEKQFYAYQNGNVAIGLRIDRESGANVLATLNEVKSVIAELRDGVLKENGLGIEQSFDSSLFINRAINLLSGNLLAGVLLAVGCLWWFLRDRRATLLIASAIPISLLATFIVLDLAGRSLNVISLAGLAFAVGMVMDAAVVVAENIVRLRESGKMPFEAASLGTRQVAGALVASTLTTVAVFVPVIFMDDVEGQLFADLALTISIAVAISMLIAVTVLPAAASGWLKAKRLASLSEQGYPRVTAALMRWTNSKSKQVSWIALLVAAPCVASWLLVPRLDYLPPVKRAAIDAFFSFPPGMSPAIVDREIVQTVLARMEPYMKGEKDPALKNWYMLLWPGGGTLGARVVDEDRIGDLEAVVRDEIVVGFPDTRAFATEGELFGAFGGSARAIQIHLQSGDTAALNAGAESGRKLLEEKFPGANVQAFPNADAAEPELRLHANDRRLAEVGWNRPDVGSVVRTLGDGMWLGEYFNGDQRLPIILRASGWNAPEQLATVPVATPQGGVLPLGDLVALETTMAPSQLRRVDRRRTVTLTVDPPVAMSLEEALAIVESEVVPALRQALPADAGVRVSGSADRLQEVVSGMASNFAMALALLFMLMAAMFKSLRDSAFVMMALPMAVFGGVLGLRVLGLFTPQSLDLLSMIGFIMLLGMVINNAILLIAQTRAGEADGLDLTRAVEQALNQRLRPILIGALTGVVGALPMAINPGPGAVIYRGIAAVTVGGVGLSLVFTLVLMPALLRLQWRRDALAAAMPAHAALKSVA
ncbi:MAG: efflux RND transporter permease subunit [Chiayiivirga sp.]|jgi:multidrug efflux pump subunit AcrB|uniref:efflux RND transporter permease subunit n=1 Tax=Chiayiivirga sp. TaxID=2041042 RepID=UPI0025BAE54C|nr:efflux RND transporter permease subunit [Chiayiivirga sp.]MCI1710426.1 efflux RND transporter permease subunit [Chiayiivirga sp.]MCI1730821.1 efflux RND transporter permease subunit [Chiayiivirga sp.]